MLQIGLVLIFTGIVIMGVAGVSSRISAERRGFAYACALFLFCTGMFLTAAPLAITHPDFSLLSYILSVIILGGVATILFGMGWVFLLSWLNKPLKQTTQKDAL